jgi:hypothetical protein
VRSCLQLGIVAHGVVSVDEVRVTKVPKVEHKAETKDTPSNASTTPKALDAVDPSSPSRPFATAPYTVEQLRSLQERCASASDGLLSLLMAFYRAEKIARDAKHRGTSETANQDLGALELADSAVLFVYAFWCRDTRRTRVDGPRTGELDSWLATASLVSKARAAARTQAALHDSFGSVVSLLCVRIYPRRACD